jgi:hypothetical protein
MATGLLSTIGIDCMLSKGGDGLRGDGCVYDLSSPHPVILNPTRLRTGDYVKLRLWFPDDNAFSMIELAEVQWVKDEWIQVEILLISPKEQSRLREFVVADGHHLPTSTRVGQQIMIRA